MKVAVIPARGGSKRIPGKNIVDFQGKPMIGWSIEAAFKAGIFDQVIVSTDDEKIAEIAQSFNADVPFIRPNELADDYSTTLDVMAHATSWLSKQYPEIETVCCIYATAPFLVAKDIVDAYAVLQQGDWKYAFSAVKSDPVVLRSFVQKTSGGIEMIFPEYYDTRSQDLPTVLHDAAQFYWGTPSAWLNHERIFAAHSVAFHIPAWRAVDIDNQEDLDNAVRMAPTVFQRLLSE